MVDKKATQELIDRFDKLREDYSCVDIDTDMLKKGLIDTVDNWS